MTTINILEEINKLPLTDKLLIIEKTQKRLKIIRQDSQPDLAKAVDNQ